MQQRNIDGSRLLQIIGAKEYELDILRERVAVLTDSLDKAEKKLAEKNEKPKAKS
jgi:hypothetical protein